MTNMIKRFLAKNDGGATTEWVVITAAVVSLSVTVGLAISAPTKDVATNINTTMDSIVQPAP